MENRPAPYAHPAARNMISQVARKQPTRKRFE